MQFEGCLFIFWFFLDRIGSEFWSQQERIGDDLSGIQ